MRPDQFMMPSAGQVWRHYRSSDRHTVIGVGQDENGVPVVVYTDAYWPHGGYPPLYTQPLGRFLSQIEVTHGGVTKHVQRFALQHQADPGCPYLAHGD